MKILKKVLIGSLLTSFIFLTPTQNENVSLADDLASQTSYSDEITYDSSKYSEEAEYVKYSLKRLGYKDKKDKELYIDGYFESKGRFALANFLSSEGLEYFNEESKNALFDRAEASVASDYDYGFNNTSTDLSSTLFMYSDVANIDSMRDPFYSMEVLQGFENLVTVRPEQMSYNARKVMDHVNKDSNIFGYINLGPNNPGSSKAKWIMADLDQLKSQIDNIADADWHGIFIDQFGYDWGETRARQNTIIDYAHSRGLSVMVNAWFPEDALGSEINKKSNPEGVESHLNSNDWSIIESFYTDGNSYRADSSYIEKYLKTKDYSEETGVKISTLSYKRNSTNWNESITNTDIENSYVLAHVLGFDGWWFAKYDNSDKFLYGKEPDLDLGSVLTPLHHDSDNKYVAETENYMIEYFAEKTPTMNLISK